MAEGIKIRELQSVGTLQDDDVFIIDTIIDGDLTTATTKNIRYDDILATISAEDLTFSGDVVFNGNLTFDGTVDLKLGELTDVELSAVVAGQGIVYDGEKWVNSEVASGSFNGNYLALEAKVNTPVVLTVTVANKVEHRHLGQGSDQAFYIDGVEAPFLILAPARTYRFDQSDPSNSGHPLAFYDNIYKGFLPLNESYMTRVGTPGTPGAYTEIELINDMTYKTFYYQCMNHDFMGNGIENPDGNDAFINPTLGPRLDSLEAQLNEIREQLTLLIEIDQP